MKLEIINGSRLSPDFQWIQSKNIRIAHGRIVDIDGSVPFEADETFDAKGQLISPGLIDLNASFGAAGASAGISVKTECLAAVASGVTTLCSAPDSLPGLNDSSSTTRMLKEAAEQAMLCRVLPVGALTQNLEGKLLSSYGALRDAGCIALGNGFNAISNLLVMRRCFDYAKTLDMQVFLNPLESSLSEGVMHEGQISSAIGLSGMPSIAESIAVAEALQLAKITGVKLHLTQLSCAESVELLGQAKSSGLEVTADVSLANLLHTESDLEGFNSTYHTEPPLRTTRDREALIEGIKSGVIDCISSGHRPVDEASKLLPFAETQAGMSTLESLIPGAFKLEKENDLPIMTFIDAMTAGPASVLGLDSPEISLNKAADLTIIDPESSYAIDSASLVSGGKNASFLGEFVKGRVVTTICNGRQVYIG